MMQKGDPVIIVKKKVAGHGGHHGGAWKVAYADFVTAMMAFFMVMWIVGQSQQVKAAVAGYFRDPGIFDHQTSGGAIGGTPVGLEPDRPMAVTVQQSPSDLLERLKETAERIREALAERPALKAMAEQIEITVTAEGLRIELVESSRTSFFDSGSAVLRDETRQVLAVIAGALGQLGKPVILEGHTDAVQFASHDGYTNWELSADRANSARRAMLGHGLQPHQIDGVRGYAATRPRIPDNPADPRNRRVSIVVRSFDERDLAVLSNSGQP
ncbi:MAG: flagellar motor protein MotB [Acidobacteriota bacterium]